MNVILPSENFLSEKKKRSLTSEYEEALLACFLVPGKPCVRSFHSIGIRDGRVQWSAHNARVHLHERREIQVIITTAQLA